ncbi:MAG: nitrile hydratase subunit alpha [Mycobacteriales bacterium]
MSDDHADAVLSRQVRAFEALLETRGLIKDADIDAVLAEFLDRASPANGARIVARAWKDDDFRDRLLKDANTTVREIGLSMGDGPDVRRLRVVDNTADVHNVVVCTLCSCYPVALLGPSPSWYKSEAYRSRVVRDPRGVLDEFGLTLPDSTEIVVWDSSALTRYMVLPQRPADSDALDEEALAALVSRNGLIGTAIV